MEIVQGTRSAEEVVWDSYGTPLERLRRIQLWRLADLHKVPYPRGATTTVMLRLLENKQIVDSVDVLNPPQGMTPETFWSLINGPSKVYNEYGGTAQDGNTNIDAMRDALEGKSHFETDKVWETEIAEDTPMSRADYLKSLSWGDLKKEAKSCNLDIPNTMKRPELEALLNG